MLEQQIDTLLYRKIWPRLFDAQEHLLPIQIDVTNACNLSCAHCYHPHHRNTGALTIGQWREVVDQYEGLLAKLRMLPRITICGGEPLLCPFLFPLIDNLRARFPDCELHLLTNGTRVTAAAASHLDAFRVSAQVSLDGPDAARHDVIRGAGSFQKALEGCRALAEAGVEFHHLAVLSRRTAAWIPDFFALPRMTGSRSMNFTRLIAEGSASDLIAQGVDSPLEGWALHRAMAEILLWSRTTGVPTATSGPLWHLIDPSRGSPSNTGWGFVIGYRGEFKVASRIALVLGNVLDDGLEQLYLRHPIMQALRKGEIESCGECPHFKKCRGDRNASYAAFQHVLGPDPGCWILPARQAQYAGAHV